MHASVRHVQTLFCSPKMASLQVVIFWLLENSRKWGGSMLSGALIWIERGQNDIMASHNSNGISNDVSDCASVMSRMCFRNL